MHNRSLEVSSCNLYSVIDYYLFILFLCQSLKECPPTQECDLLRVSTSMKQPFPVDSAHLMNRQSQKMHLTRPLRGHPGWQMKQCLIEGDGAWTLVQILGEQIFWSSLLSSWWLLTGYLWRQACTVISNPLSRGGPDACASVCVRHAPAFKRCIV